MEREAYAVENTILFELAVVGGNLNGKNLHSRITRNLTMRDSAAAFREVLAQGRPNHVPAGPSAFDPFTEGNDPQRDWRQDLATMGLGSVISKVDRAANFALPPTKRGPTRAANSGKQIPAPASPPAARRGPPRQNAR